MDALTFRSFARTAMELQSDSDTPREYTMIKAAVAAKYGISKEAASEGWIRRMTASGARKASDPRIAKFLNNRANAASAARAGADTPHNQHIIRSNYHAASQGFQEEAHRSMFKRKLAWNTGELAGLGILAAPSASNLAGKEWGDKSKDVSEVTGLGMLAAPYAHNMASSKSVRYANSQVGQRLARAFSR